MSPWKICSPRIFKAHGSCTIIRLERFKMAVGWLVTSCIVVAAGTSMALKWDTDKEDSKPEHTCDCGWEGKKRIVNGVVADKNEFPFMLAVVDLDKEEAFCGASLLTGKHALTAAHCTQPYKDSQTLDKLAVISGGHDLEDTSQDVQKLSMVEDTVEHEGYDTRTFANDIAVLVLKTEVAFTQDMGPVCLPAPQAVPLGILDDPATTKPTKLTVIGWGRLSRMGRTSQVLMKTWLGVTATADCIKSYSTTAYPVHAKKHLCTFKNDSDSCQGDSGGPLFWKHPDTNRFTQVALVSFGMGCADNTYPGVNTDVTYHMNWILDKVKVSGKDAYKVCHKN